MKRKRNPGDLLDNRKGAKSARRPQQLNENAATELLKLALERVCALQAELARETDDGQADPETAGFAACAVETFRFLASEGMSPDHPVVRRLTQHLLGTDTARNG